MPMDGGGAVTRPNWWNYPEGCQFGHPWGPGRVIVGWLPCSCDPARKAQQRGPGHLTVSCQAPGCRSVWYRPDHDPETATPHAYPAPPATS